MSVPLRPLSPQYTENFVNDTIRALCRSAGLARYRMCAPRRPPLRLLGPPACNRTKRTLPENTTKLCASDPALPPSARRVQQGDVPPRGAPLLVRPRAGLLGRGAHPPGPGRGGALPDSCARALHWVSSVPSQRLSHILIAQYCARVAWPRSRSATAWSGGTGTSSTWP